MADRLFSTLVAALLTTNIASADDASPEMPGRANGDPAKIVMFSVSDEKTQRAVYRAMIACKQDRRRYYTYTDEMGIAMLAFKKDPSNPARLRFVSCVIEKHGFAPDTKILDLKYKKTPLLSKIRLKTAIVR